MRAALQREKVLTEITLVIGPCLFAIGLFGFLTRRNLILMFLSLELMLAAVSLNFIAFGSLHGDLGGQVFAIFILVVAACEAALALSLIVALVKSQGTLDVMRWSELREQSTTVEDSRQVNLQESEASERLNEEMNGRDEDFPKLTPAGLDPRLHPIEADFKLPNEVGKA